MHTGQEAKHCSCIEGGRTLTAQCQCEQPGRQCSHTYEEIVLGDCGTDSKDMVMLAWVSVL